MPANVWCVCDPEHDSGIEDVLWEADGAKLQRVIIGASLRRGADPSEPVKGLTVYASAAVAKRDAVARLAARKAYDEALRTARSA